MHELSAIGHAHLDTAWLWPIEESYRKAVRSFSSQTIGWLRRFAKLWGFALFCIFVVFAFREVVLPFLFAVLVAYILAPLVNRFGRLTIRGKPFPRGLAVIILYINIIAVLALFISYFIPKLSSDSPACSRRRRN